MYVMTLLDMRVRTLLDMYDLSASHEYLRIDLDMYVMTLLDTRQNVLLDDGLTIVLEFGCPPGVSGLP